MNLGILNIYKCRHFEATYSANKNLFISFSVDPFIFFPFYTTEVKIF